MKNDQNAINWERSRVVRVFAALVLIIAAVLKLNGLYLDPFSGETFLSTPHVQLATVFVQLFLGGWLLSGVSPRSAWLSTILLFVLFALASLYLWLAAQRSCNCFGQLHVHPLYVFFFDLSMVAALLFSPPPPESTRALRLGGIIRLLGIFCISIGLVIGLIYLFIDNPAHLLARLRQEEVVITPTSTNLGSGQVGDTREVEVLFTNTTDQPVRIYGGSADCNCVKTDALPFTILPHGEQSITIKITFVGNPGRVQHRFTFLTDSKQKQVITRFAMQIVELPKADGISGIQVNDGHQLGFVVEE